METGTGVAFSQNPFLMFEQVTRCYFKDKISNCSKRRNRRRGDEEIRMSRDMRIMFIPQDDVTGKQQKPCKLLLCVSYHSSVGKHFTVDYYWLEFFYILTCGVNSSQNFCSFSKKNWPISPNYEWYIRWYDNLDNVQGFFKYFISNENFLCSKLVSARNIIVLRDTVWDLWLLFLSNVGALIAK